MTVQAKNFFTALVNDVTGPHLFNAQSYLFFLPVFWITSLLANAELGSLESLAVWTLANAVAMLACWFLIWVVDRKVIPRRDQRPTPILVVLLLAMGVGAAKGAITTMIAWVLGHEASLEVLPGRILQTAFLGLVTIPALAIFSAARSRLQSERDSLIFETVNRELSRTKDQSHEDVEILRLELSKIALHPGEETEIPPLLREVVSVNLRQISHRLWEKESGKLQNLSIASMSKVAMLSHPFVGLPVALILSIGAFVPYLERTNLYEALVRSLITFTIILSTYFFASKWQPKSLFIAWAYFLVGNLASAIAIVVLSHLCFGDIAGYSPIASTVVLYIWMTQTGFMTSFFKRLFSTRLELRERLLELGQDFKFESAAHRISAAMANRELANHLHSSVQNRLLALALMIERGQRVSISDELQAIDQLLANFRQTDPGSLIQELEELRSRWSGIAEVEFEFDAVPTENYEVVLKAVSEAINNSIRHGMATKLSVTVANLESGYMITVTDDGLGPRNGAKGLGSMYFDSITDGGWALRPLDGGGTQLTLAIPNRVAR